MAVALLFVEKIRQRAALFSSGLGVVSFLQTIYSRAEIQRTIVDSPTFVEHGSVKKIEICAHTTRDRNEQDDWRHFCMKRHRTFKSFQIFKKERQKLKTYSD